MGRFRDLLGATAKHPAMLFYLDNWQNTGPNSPGAHGRFHGLNENYARELMELHTIGVSGGYSQADVIALAHILTGWGLVSRAEPNSKRTNFARTNGWLRAFTFERFSSGRRRRYSGASYSDFEAANGFYFDQQRHDFAAQIFLGQPVAAGGLRQGETALDILARSPATAIRLSRKLGEYFVADEPPSDLVERMARRYLETDGDVREVLRTLFFSAEFWESRYYRAKFKTPSEFVISATRATGIRVLNVRPLAGAMRSLGMPLFGCQSPDGYQQTQQAWLSPDGMMMRLNFAAALGAGRLPLQLRVDEFEQDEAGRAGERAIRPVVIPTTAASAAHPAGLDPLSLIMTLGDLLSPRTRNVVEAAPLQLRAPLILGSPEFMMR
jgi:uncharacterized protein (DUF1800 family)